MRRNLREWLLLAGTLLVGFLALAAFGWTSPAHDLRGTYLLGVAVIVSVYALLALGLSMEMGYAGLLNFGHVAFMGLGAYAMAVFTIKNRGQIAPALEGAQPWAFVVLGLMGLALAFVVYVLALALLQKLRAPRRAAVLGALAVALAAGAFVAIKAYPLGPRESVNAVLFLGILLGVALASIAGLLVGFVGLRLREDYLAIATLGFAEVMRLVAINEEQVTNGTQGIQSIPVPLADWALRTPWFRDLARAWDVQPVTLVTALVAVVAVVIAFVVLEILARSPWGRVLKAIREDEEVASSLGKNVLLYKLQALMLGSGLAALAGIVFTFYVASVVPENFLSIVTFYSFAILVLGGVGNHKGAIIGAAIIWGIFEFANNLTSLEFFRDRGIQFAGPPQAILIGLVLILVVVLRPQGLVGSKEEMALGK